MPAVTGVVFRDTGGDGLRDAADSGIAGVTVELLKGDEAVAQAKTGPTGAYTFTTLEAATDYQLRIATTQAPLADLAPAEPDLGDDDAADSDFAAGEEGVAAVDFTTDTGDEALKFDAGFAPANPELALGGQVFADADNSGLLDEGETGVAGVTVELVGETSDTALNTTTTGTDGTYTFSGLEPGTYRVRLAASNFADTGPLAGRAPSESSNPTVDDDIDGDSNGEADGTLGSGGVVLTGPITLAAGEEPTEDGDTSPNTNLTVDFGIAPVDTTPPPTPTGTSISGRVFLDYDNSGATNGPDAGVVGVTITLSGGALTEPLTTQTGADGSFTFSDLAAGTYTLTETQPTTPASQTGKDTAGSTGGTTDDANAIAGIELAEGDAATGYTFAEVPLVSTGGTVFVDANDNGTFDTGEAGVPGVTVTLTGTSAVDGEITPVTATTDDQGAYTFDDLTPGTYTIAETQPAGFTDAAEQNGTPAATVTDDTFAGIDLTSTAAESGGFNFAETSDTTPPPTTTGGSLAGAVFEDANGDRTRQSAEAGIAGITVRLTGTTDGGPVDRTATTGTDGSFDFTGLAAGTYTLTETQPTGRPDGAETAGTAGGTTTTNDAIGGITLAADQAGTGYLFAERAATTPGDGEGAADVRTALFVNTPRVPPGGFVVLTAVVRNRGDAGAAGPAATVNLGGLRFVSASSDAYDPESETWTVGELGAGESAVLRITAQVPSPGAYTPVVAVTDGEGLTADRPRVAATTVLATWMPLRWFLLSSWFGGLVPTPPVVPVGPPPPATTRPPATPTLNLAAVSDTGTAGDRTTDLATVTLAGTTTAGADVTLVETGATATADDAGAFEFADVPLTVGNNEFTVRATNAGGTRTGTATITRVEATTVEPPATPTLGLAAASDTGEAGDGTTNLEAVTLTGTATAGAEVELVETGATATADLTGAYQFADVPVVLGANTFTVRATTTGGTSSATTTVTRVAAAPENAAPAPVDEPEDPPPPGAPTTDDEGPRPTTP